MNIQIIVVAATLAATPASANPLKCSLTDYRALPGLTATAADDTLAVTWDGDKDTELRVRFAIDGGTPAILERDKWNAF